MRALLIALSLVLVALIGAALWLPGYLENEQNRVAAHDPYEISAETKSLHNSLFIADLHSDTLLWQRDPLNRAERGHVDIPRLSEGNVALQVFPAVTKAPQGQNYESNTADTDMITYLVMAQRWPSRTWSSLTERALYQSERLHRAEAKSPDTIKIIRTQTDLQTVIDARAAGEPLLGALLATEGSHALDGDLANIDRLHTAGYRIMGLHHFFDNKLGGSLHGISKAGLTDFGRTAVQEMVARGIIIDLAHSSEAVAQEVLDLIDRPVIVSHTGLKGHCDSERNFADDLMKAIAEAGGLIGVGYWDGAVCEISPANVAKAIRYGVELVGEDHIALGSDYDGATEVAFDTSELAALTDALLSEGLSDDTIAKVMGGNVRDFMLEHLPE